MEEINQSTESLTTTNNQTLETPKEKMLSQTEVNDLVGRVKQEAAHKAVENYKRNQQSQMQSEAPKESNLPINEERFRRMAAEEAQRLRDEWLNDAQQRSDEESAKRIVKSFYDKMEAGRQKYDDFDKVTSDLELRRFPNTVQILAEHIDNSHDVMYELSKNRAKLAQIEVAAKEGYSQEAIYELRRLAESIKNNDVASNRREANAPLHQQRPSNLGADSGSVLSMKDLKAKYRA